MKHIQSHILYIGIILLLLGITGCRKHYPVAEKLLQAEAVMNEYPDSALNLLKGIAQPELQNYIDKSNKLYHTKGNNILF